MIVGDALPARPTAVLAAPPDGDGRRRAARRLAAAADRLVELVAGDRAISCSSSSAAVGDPGAACRAGLRARAEYEHRLSVAGDPRGVYGRYPPVQSGWFADPQNGWQLRYFDGAVWTPYTSRR